MSESIRSSARCDLCGGIAVYYRFSSGHRLCLGCLGKVLEHSIRKYLKLFNVLKPGSRILIPITYYNTLASLGLADISLLLKKGYGSEILVALPDFVIINRAPVRFNKLKLVKLNVKPKPCFEDAILAVHYDRLWSLKLASLLGFNFILMPLTRTDLTLLTLEIPLRGYSEAWGILEDNVSVGIVNALAAVEAEAIVSYATLSGYDVSLVNSCYSKLESARVLRELRGLGPELEFSSYKVTEILLRLANSRFMYRCPYCKGFSATNDICMLCRLVNAHDLMVTITVSDST